MPNGLKQDISIGKTLKIMRRRVHLTQSEAAAQLEVIGLPMTQEILAKIEQGRYSIKISVLVGLKQVYKVNSFDEFFAGI